MLVIRRAQIDIFQEMARTAFEDAMLLHLREFSPPLYATLGDAQMYKIIRLGMDNAKGYGVTFRGPVRLYLEMMLLFGSHFDTDPQYPWAAEVLRQVAQPQMDRAALLYAKSLDYLKHVVGPEDAYTIRALRKLSVLARQPITFSPDGEVLEQLAEVYPEKAEYVGKEGLQALIAEGKQQAHAYGLMAAREIALFIILMFAFGHGCADDPLYPWIARVLKANPVKRAKRLETRALIWLDHVLKDCQ
jgi:hypothetical protein